MGIDRAASRTASSSSEDSPVVPETSAAPAAAQIRAASRQPSG